MRPLTRGRPFGDPMSRPSAWKHAPTPGRHRDGRRYRHSFIVRSPEPPIGSRVRPLPGRYRFTASGTISITTHRFVPRNGPFTVCYTLTTRRDESALRLLPGRKNEANATSNGDPVPNPTVRVCSPYRRYRGGNKDYTNRLKIHERANSEIRAQRNGRRGRGK